MRRSVPLTTILAGLVAFLAGACAPATVNKQSVQATAEAPDSTRVDLVRVPYNPSLPYYVVTIEPFTFDADGAPTASTPRTPGTRYGWGPWGWGLLPTGPSAEAYNPPTQGATQQMGVSISNQLVTALGNAGNIRIIDYEYYWQRKDKPASMVRKNGGEVGPFLIRGSVTEFNEIAEASGSSTGGSAGAVGAALGVAGAIAGNREAAIAGTALGLANPTYEKTEARRTGSVAIDVRIIDPMNGRVAGTVNANGSFTSQSAANGFSLFGFGKASNAFAASALGQANRAAMNSATEQIVARLSKIR
jgi:curli biogenesis system outer membrane secretion channel CsgG